MANPFVQVVSTGDIGRLVSTSEVGDSVVEFNDSLLDIFSLTIPITGIREFVPESNDVVWVPQTLVPNDGSPPIVVYHRGTFRLARGEQWGVTVRRPESVRGDDEFLDPNKLLIHRNGKSFKPVGALASNLSMSSKYFVTRDNLLGKLYKQIEVSRGYRSILGSAVRPFRHQINTVIRVLSDPTPRFILADEVGLGKTIEAGLIIRQVLLDNHNAKIVVLSPKSLVGQWKYELSTKLLLGEHLQRGEILVMPYGVFPQLNICDLLVVDEAHQISEKGKTEIYENIRKTLPQSSALLLLTATPMRGDREELLKLLHLLDSNSYPLELQDQFEKRIEMREQSARDIDYLKIIDVPLASLEDCLKRIETIIPLDEFCIKSIKKIRSLLGDGGRAAQERASLSTYLRETYRISRRVIRNRRSVVSEEGFIVAGRELKNGRPEEVEEVLRVEIDGVISQILEEIKNLLKAEKIEYKIAVDLVSSLIESGLSAPEVFLSEINQELYLSGHSIFSESLLDSIIEIRSRILSQGSSSRWDRVLQICRDHVTYPKSGGVVVFTRSTDVAAKMNSQLVEILGIGNVRAHLQTMSEIEQDHSIEYFLQESGCRVLVMDRSGEEGRNLQEASEIIHFSIPLNPNKLEQRLGRADRFCEVAKHRASSTVFIEHASALITGQFALLDKGLNIFRRSVATAQHRLSIEFENMVRGLLENGLDAFVNRDSFSDLEALVDEAIETVEYVDLIESASTIHEFSIEDFEQLLDVDEDSEVMDAAIGLYVDDANRNPPTTPIGLMTTGSKFAKQDLTQTMRLSLKLDDRRPAELRNLKSNEKRELQDFVLRDNEYAFSRTVARALRGSLLYRVGDPLVDWTIGWIEESELGRVWAVWREKRDFDFKGRSTVGLFSGSVRVGYTSPPPMDFSVWACNCLARRNEMSLPSQLKYFHQFERNVLDLNDESVRKHFPPVRLTDKNIEGKDWLKVHDIFPDFEEKCHGAAESILRETKKSILNSREFEIRKTQEVLLHQHVVSILETDISKIESLTRDQSLIRLQEESQIHEIVMESLSDPPCNIFSFGLIVLSKHAK